MRLSTLRPGSWAAVFSLFLVMIAAADDAPPVGPPPHETPFGRFLGELFQNIDADKTAPRGQREPVGDPLPDVEPQRQIVLDAVDERALAGREQQRDLEQAQRLLERGDTVAGVMMLQQLLDSDEDTLLLSPEGHWVSLQHTAEELLGRADAEVRQTYEARFAVLAEERLQRARETARPQDFAEVSKRFLHTSSGQQAARILSGLFRDAGDSAEADYWMHRTGTKPDSPQATAVDADDGPSQKLSEWRQPFGGPSHRGLFPETDPVMLERWSAPMTVRPAVAEQVERIVRDLVDNRSACIPTTIPLAVGGRIITRTLRGLSVFDADSGRLIWESAEGASVERLLSGEDVPRPGGETSGRATRAIPAYNGANPDAHPLAGLLFRDGVYGHISSDGQRVFVLEDHASLSFRQPGYFWGQRVQDDPFGRDWETNQLVAYDLKSGSIRWRIGGEQLGEPFDPPLAGTLFMGPPVIDGGELFIIGERDGTVSLFVLDGPTGQPLWSQAISEVSATINHDLVRRWWPAQPAVGPGVIVCPTTAGWMVAIDRLQRRIRWTYRYIEGRQKKVSSNRSRVASAGPLNTRWCPSAPILTERQVLFTPAELPDPLYGDQPRIVCLDLLTGERIWWEQKRQNLYVAGVVKDRVLLVGNQSVEAREVATGKRVWETSLDLRTARMDHNDVPPARSLPGDVGPPSGRGIIAGKSLLLPLQSGQLWFLHVETGTVQRSIALRDDDRPLGNLLAYRGRLLSVDPLSIRCFKARAAVIDELARASDRSVPVQTRLRAAELQFLEGAFRDAHQTLRSLGTDDLSASQRAHADRLRWDSLVQLVRRDLDGADRQLAEMAELAKTPVERITLERTRADQFQARGDLNAAFDVYWRLAQSPSDMLVEEGLTSIHTRRWIAGRLAAIWSLAEDDERHSFDRQIRKIGETQRKAGEARQWWSDVLRFHDVGWELRREIADDAQARGQWTKAETTLLQIIEEGTADPPRLQALEQLARLMLERDRRSDAVRYLEHYSASIAGGEALRQAMVNRIPAHEGSGAPTTSDGRWTLTRSAASFNRAMVDPVLAIEPGLPSVSRLNLRLEPNLHRLRVESDDEETFWETPLREQVHTFYNQTTAIASVGQLLFVVHRGVLQAVSLADRELLWQREFDLQSAASGHVRGPSNDRHEELRTVEHFIWSAGLRQTRAQAGMLAVWRPGYVAYFGRNSITLADPLSGETLWKRNGIAPRTMVYGTAAVLFVVPPAPEDAYALSVVDGSEVPAPRLDTLVASAVCISDGGLLQIEQRHPFRLFGWGEPTIRVRLIDPISGDERRSESFPAETRFGLVDDQQIIAVNPDGAVSLISALSGDSLLLGSVGEETMQGSLRLFAIVEPERIYLAFNKPPRPGAYSRGYQACPVHGTLAAFDRGGGLLWSTAVDDQNLIVDQLSQLPVLVLSSQRSERDGEVTSQIVFVELRDKQTGELLLQDSRYVNSGNVQEMIVDSARQTIDLNTYKDRLRLQVVPP